MIRDMMRLKVYRASWALANAEWNTRLETVSEAQAWVDTIVGSRWYHSYRVVSKRGGPVRSHHRTDVVLSDGRGRRSACHYIGTAEIALPRSTRDRLTILHELAHLMVPERPAHGRTFVQVHLDLVRRWIGHDAWRDLREAYQQQRVKWRAYPAGHRYRIDQRQGVNV